MATLYVRERRAADGSPRFQVIYRFGGRTTPSRALGTFDRREDAERRAKLAHDWLVAGRDPQTELARIARKSLTVLELLPPTPPEITVRPPDAATVYVARARAGQVIYIGITSTGPRRLRAHDRSALWWHLADTVELFHFDTRAEAEANERRLISELRPAFNVTHQLTLARIEETS